MCTSVAYCISLGLAVWSAFGMQCLDCLIHAVSECTTFWFLFLCCCATSYQPMQSIALMHVSCLWVLHGLLCILSTRTCLLSLPMHLHGCAYGDGCIAAACCFAACFAQMSCCLFAAQLIVDLRCSCGTRNSSCIFLGTVPKTGNVGACISSSYQDLSHGFVNLKSRGIWICLHANCHSCFWCAFAFLCMLSVSIVIPFSLLSIWYAISTCFCRCGMLPCYEACMSLALIIADASIAFIVIILCCSQVLHMHLHSFPLKKIPG